MAPKKTNGTKRKAKKVAADTSENKVVEVRQIAPNKLKRAIADCIAILEDNSSRAGEIGNIKRECAEQGMDPQAFGILQRLKRKGLTNPHVLGTILRSFDFGREALGLDDMVPADFFEAPTEGRKTNRKKKASDEESAVADAAYATEPRQIDIVIEHSDDTNVENIDDHRAA